MVLKTKRASSDAWSLAVGRLLAKRLGDKIVQFRPDVVVPIPMHWMRRLLRGVNSPELFAECLGKSLATPVLGTLRRRRYTSPQKDLSPRERFRNVRGAFVLIESTGGVSGTFAGLPEGATVTYQGTTYHISYDYNPNGGVGDDVALIPA